MLLLTAGDDQVVPAEQTSRFAQAAQAAGGEVAQLIFEGGVHGGGGVNCAAGRAAILSFLRHHSLLDEATDTDHDGEYDNDPGDVIGGALRVFKMEATEYGPPAFEPAVHGRGTLRLQPQAQPPAGATGEA